MKAIPHTRSRVAGAALPIALILLVVVTLLAVAGMRTAGLGFIMAGNDQFRQKAFLASETGIEQANTFGTFNPSVVSQTFAGTVTGAATDTYSAVIARQLNGVAQGAIWGNSWNAFSTYHFEIDSTGTSVRNATTLHDQGVAVMAPYNGVQGCANPPCASL